MKNNLILFNSLLNDDYDSFVKKIFNYNSLINNINDNGETLLHYCCYYGLIEKFYALINMGAEIKTTNDRNSLLHYACLSGKDDFLVLELVKLGLNPTDKNSLGETAFHCVSNEKISHYLNLWAKRNNVNICELLDDNLNTVAHSCKINGNINCVHYWILEYPNLNDTVNIFNKKWIQCKKRISKKCPY